MVNVRVKKKYKNIIIGSGFSAFVLNFFLNKEALIITTSVNLLKGYPKRKKESVIRECLNNPNLMMSQ